MGCSEAVSLVGLKLLANEVAGLGVFVEFVVKGLQYGVGHVCVVWIFVPWWWLRW